MMMGIQKLSAMALALLFSAVLHASPGELGVILMHGKQGSPDTTINELADALGKAGYLVSTPTCAWSKGRIYDTTVEGALLEIDREVAALRAKGAKRVVIAGQSLGGSVALRYAATRKGMAGVIALAPAHNPDSAAARRLFSADLARARKLIAESKGDQTESFLDANLSTFSVVVTPKQYVSWWGEEDGDLLAPRNAAGINPAIPLLFVVGSQDSLTRPKAEVFDKAPAHAASKYVTVNARHLEVPTAARDEVLTWLAALPP